MAYCKLFVGKNICRKNSKQYRYKYMVHCVIFVCSRWFNQRIYNKKKTSGIMLRYACNCHSGTYKCEPKCEPDYWTYLCTVYKCTHHLCLSFVYYYTVCWFYPWIVFGRFFYVPIGKRRISSQRKYIAYRVNVIELNNFDDANSTVEL